MTSAPACLPSTPEPSTPDSAADTPWLAGTGAEDRAPASTWLAAAAGRVATRSMFHSARRPGIMAATATPAPSVNTLIMASAITMMARSRFTGRQFTGRQFTGRQFTGRQFRRMAAPACHWPVRHWPVRHWPVRQRRSPHEMLRFRKRAPATPVP